MSRRLFAAFIALAAAACGALNPPSPTPAAAWNADPQAVVIRATLCCGFVPQAYALNYIPDATVWGDGRIVWAQPGNDGARRVLEARLTSDEMQALLRRALDDGFFGWQESYADYSVTDLPSKCLSVEITGQSKTVCEYYRGAPEAFHALYAHVAGGAGASGAEYVPDKGYLTAYPQSFPNPPAPNEVFHWPAGSLDFSLKEAEGGKWIEGEALKLAWRVVNGNVWANVAQDGDQYYQLVVQVPGLSQNAPPEP
jgi:hypothetical protein